MRILYIKVAQRDHSQAPPKFMQPGPLSAKHFPEDIIRLSIDTFKIIVMIKTCVLPALLIRLSIDTFTIIVMIKTFVLLLYFYLYLYL